MADAMDVQEQEAYRKATGQSIGGTDAGQLGKSWDATFQPGVSTAINPAQARAYQQRIQAEAAARKAAPVVNPYQQGKRGVYGNF